MDAAIAEVSSSINKSKIIPREFRHVPALDGLRGIAVLTVMLYHLDFLVPEIHPFVKGGFLGVDIFFVLSGFLITSILLKEYEKTETINLKNFFYRRLFRLVPAFWFFLICLYFFGNYILPSGQANIIYENYNFFFAVSYLMNWFCAANEGLTGNLNHTWSLAIEEQFYILWSVVLYKAFSEGRGRRQIFVWTIGSILILICWRSFRASTGTSTNILYYSTDTRIDALLIGCAASMIYIWNLIPDRFFKSNAFNFLTLGALFSAFWVLLNYSYVDSSLYLAPLPVFSISVSVIILWLMTRVKTPVHFVLELKLFRWIGTVSYSLYLWHYVMYEFGKKNFSSVPMQVIIALFFAFAISTASFYLIEKPFLKLKDRFGSPQRSAS